MKRILTISLLLLAVICTVSADRRRLLGVRNVAAGATSPTPEILWWKLNEGSGTSITGDGSNGGDDGTTDANWLTGQSGSGSCLDFVAASSDDAATSASITYTTNAITVTFWMYLDSVTGTQIILESSANFNSNNDCYAAFMNGSTLTIQLKKGGARTESLAGLTTGAWHHYAILFDKSSTAGDIRLWIDNAEQTLSVDATSNDTVTDFAAYVLYVGARASSSLFLDGRIDDFRVYAGSYAASLADIYADSR